MSKALDLSLLKGTPEQREAICAELLRVLKTRGGVKLKNHGISDELIDGLFDYVGALSLWLNWTKVSLLHRLAIFSPCPTTRR